MVCRSRSRFSFANSMDLKCVGAALVVGGIVSMNSVAQTLAAESSGPTFVHPERGGLMLETEERRFLANSAPRKVVPPIDPRLSIFITDRATMAQITFREVMQQLVDQSGDRTLTPKQLYQTWWDSADTKPKAGGAAEITNAAHHCNDEQATPNPNTHLATMNGFPYRCPRIEKSLATEDPFDASTPDTNYIAIAYSMRFDLADPTGRDCGEYRIVFARGTGADTGDPSAPGGDAHPGNPLDRNLIIFEARVKNPAPPIGLATSPAADPATQGPSDSMANLKGCKPLIDAFAALSRPMTTTARGVKLHDLYLKGIPSAAIGPIVSIDNYHGDGNGQIRTNQFVDHGADPTDSSQNGNFIWTLREFKVARVPDGTSSIQIIPQTVKANPSSTLFDATTAGSQVDAFIDKVVGQLGPLRGGLAGEGNINTFSYNNPDNFNSFESDESDNAAISGGGKLGSVFLQFEAQRGVLYGQLKQALADQQSRLTPDQIVARIQTQTCAGCHRFSNRNLKAPALNDANDLGGGLVWSQSLAFTHESERDFEGGPDGNASRFLISDLLKDTFLPARLDNMRRFLAED